MTRTGSENAPARLDRISDQPAVRHLGTAYAVETRCEGGVCRPAIVTVTQSVSAVSERHPTDVPMDALYHLLIEQLSISLKRIRGFR